MTFKLLAITIIGLILFNSCGNKIEEIKNPTTGKLLIRYEYYTDEAGQKIKDGDYFEWHDDGVMKEESHYKDDLLDGKRTIYLKNGGLFWCEYLEGKKHGQAEQQNNDEIAIIKENFANDKLDGQQLYFHENGDQRVIGYYKDGIQSNTWKYFNFEGKHAIDFSFKSGVCMGLLGEWRVINYRNTTMTFKEDGEWLQKKPQSRYSPYSDRELVGKWSMKDELIIEIPNGIVGKTKLLRYPILKVVKDTIYLINSYSNNDDYLLTIVKM